MSDLEVYRRHPLLEREWSAFRGYRRASLEPSARWYGARLAEGVGPVCELACGYGRLLIPAALAGRAVLGTDAVVERVSAARRVFREHGAEGRFEVLRLPRVPRGQRFGDVLLACNALGYLVAEEAKAELFSNIREMLLPGGRFLFDHGRGSAVLRALGRWPPVRGTLGRSGHALRNELRWDRRGRCVRERFVEETPDGEIASGVDLFRFPPARDTLELARRAGFATERVCGSFGGDPLRPWSRRLVVVARRR